jgi:predicted NAD/FAD-binding protein
MFTFPKLGDFYAAWAMYLRKHAVEIRTGHELVSILSRSSSGVVVQTRPTGAEGEEISETYDELVLAVLADDAKRLLGGQARFLERQVLGSAKFFEDITVTHNDLDYFEKYYETKFKDELVLKDVKEEEQKEQVEFAKREFAPMYYTHSYEKDPKRIEMSFDWYLPPYQTKLSSFLRKWLLLPFYMSRL